MSEVDRTAAPSLSDAIERIMANPEIISMVASAIGTKAPVAESSAKVSDIPPEEPAPMEESVSAEASPPDLGAMMTSLAPLLSGLRGGKDGSESHSSELGESKRREALLCALKPYVSDGRREAIDYIIRISEVSDLIRHIK